MNGAQLKAWLHTPKGKTVAVAGAGGTVAVAAVAARRRKAAAGGSVTPTNALGATPMPTSMPGPSTPDQGGSTTAGDATQLPDLLSSFLDTISGRIGDTVSSSTAQQNSVIQSLQNQVESLTSAVKALPDPTKLPPKTSETTAVGGSGTAPIQNAPGSATSQALTQNFLQATSLQGRIDALKQQPASSANYLTAVNLQKQLDALKSSSASLLGSPAPQAAAPAPATAPTQQYIATNPFTPPPAAATPPPAQVGNYLQAVNIQGQIDALKQLPATSQNFLQAMALQTRLNGLKA